LKFILVCSLLRKKYQKSKSKEKIWIKKENKKIAKEKRRDKKGAHKEHSIALLFVVPFALFVFPLLPFILVSLPYLSQLVLEIRIDQQPGQVLWTFIQYCYLLLNCVPHIYICSLCAFQAPHIYSRSVQKKFLAILVPRPHRYHEPATGCTVHCFALVRTLVRA
jgi:hypothetical protein